MTLTFDPEKHRYRLDGKAVPGVTTLLGGFPKVLQYWSARAVAEFVADNPDRVDQLRAEGRNRMVGYLKEVPWDTRDAAAGRGTEVHALAERLVADEEVEVPEPLIGHVEGYARWLDLWQPEPLVVERPVANRTHWYAGTPDLFADIGGTVYALDIKTSRGVYGETASQLAAYARAEFYTETDGGLEVPLPRAERYGVLHVREDGTEFRPVRDPARAWDDFLLASAVYRGKSARDKQIGEPLRHPSEIEDVA